jgi:hypothetical protein
MPVTGTLETMTITELLRWLEQNKTGELELQHAKLTQKLWVENGRIAGFGSNDPPSLLGQFLLARGKIDEATLDRALSMQKENGESLGAILVSLGTVSEPELLRYLRTKAEEAILKMFEWDNASFQFNSNATRDPKLVRLDIRIEKLLVEGAQRREEMAMMKRTLGGEKTLLCRTDKTLDSETAGSPVARRVYELVDGKRSFGEILLQSRASEYLVMKFLYELNRRGIIRVQENRPGSRTLDDAESCCSLADDLAAAGEYEAAMDILKYAMTVGTADSLADQKLGVIESIFLNKTYAELTPPQMVPALLCDADSIGDLKGLKPPEYYLLSQIAENEWNVETLVRLTPMYEVDVLRGLKKLLSAGVIRMDRSGAANEEREVTPEAAREIDSVIDNLTDEVQAMTSTDQQQGF